MVILLKQHAPQAEQERLLAWLRELGAEVPLSVKNHTMKIISFSLKS